MFEEESLFTPIESDRDMLSGSSQLFIDFLNQIEGWKTKCKNLHWAAPKKNIHVYLDEFLEILSDYQDSLAEGYMGILGTILPYSFNSTSKVKLKNQTIKTKIKNDI